MDPESSSTRQRLTAWTYHVGPGAYYQPAYHHVAAAIGLDRGAFLDVGCGPGWLPIHVASGRPDLDAVGIDTSPSMIALAQRNRGPRLNVTFRQMDGANIVYPDETFHAVAAIQSAHHWTDPASILLEVHRVLRTGHSFYIYEADADAKKVPRGWIHRRGPWPPDRYVLQTWRRYGMNEEAWNELKRHVSSSPFGGGEDGRHGFYRRLVLTR